MKKKIIALIVSLTILAPSSILLAASDAPPTDFKSLISKILSYINVLIPFVISLTVLMFIWGVFKYVMAGDSEEEQTKGRQFMIYGIISLFVMVSVWGFVNILNSTVFGGTLYIPQLQ